MLPARAAAISVVQTLRNQGHQALLAGGCVRDELLGRVPSDYDVVTDATPQAIASFFPRTAEVGAHFGVMLVRIDVADAAGHLRKQVIEVATFRADGSYSDKRRPDAVTFSSPAKDAQRRDFTVNALFLDPLATPGDPSISGAHPGAECVSVSQGLVIDYVRGLADLEQRLLRAVGNPDARLAEDHLRALRAVRLAGKLEFAIVPETASAITRHAGDLQGVSKERIGDEFRQMMEHPSRARAITMLAHLCLLRQVLQGIDLPSDSMVAGFTPRLLAALPEAAIAEGGLSGTDSAGGISLCLAALLLDLGLQVGLAMSDPRCEAIISQTRSALCLSNLERDRLASVLRVLPRLADGSWQALPVAAQKRLACGFGFADAQALLQAQNPTLAHTIANAVIAISNDGIGLAPEPILTGDHLVAWGLKPGKQFKDLLDLVLDAQLEGRVLDLAQARELVDRSRVSTSM